MNLLPKLPLFLLLLALLIPLQAMPATAAPVDYSIYAELLSRHVEGGLVDYAGMQKGEAKLDRFLEVLAWVKPASLSRDEQMAFYINVYNAWTIKLILTEYPGIESIRDIGSIFSNPWKQKIVRVDGKVLHLDNVEHDILRPQFKDPRVHFAVNCASKSCPPLLSEPYTGAKLQSQLQTNALSFINEPSYNFLAGKELYVSKIFNWFSEDFMDGDIVAFIKQYAQGDLKKRLDALGDGVELNYLDYDWSLNSK